MHTAKPLPAIIWSFADKISVVPNSEALLWSSVNITDNKSELFLCGYAAMSVLTGCVE